LRGGAACGLRPPLPETVRVLVETSDARRGDSAARRYFVRLAEPLQHMLDAGVPTRVLSS
jgi:hypothetical protein